MDQIIGTCSLCGGAVTVPQAWGGWPPPVPTCQNCGATKRASHGQIIEMERRPKTFLTGCNCNPGEEFRCTSTGCPRKVQGQLSGTNA